MSHRYVDYADRAEGCGCEGPARSLPPLEVDNVHENGNPAERNKDCPVLETEDSPSGTVIRQRCFGERRDTNQRAAKGFEYANDSWRNAPKIKK